VNLLASAATKLVLVLRFPLRINLSEKELIQRALNLPMQYDQEMFLMPEEK